MFSQNGLINLMELGQFLNPKAQLRVWRIEIFQGGREGEGEAGSEVPWGLRRKDIWVTDLVKLIGEEVLP